VSKNGPKLGSCHAHLVVEHLGLASLGLGDQGRVKDVQDILAHLLQLSLDLLAVIPDDGNVLLRALGLLLLLDGGDDAPGGTAGTNNVLVSDGQEVALIDGKLATNLHNRSVNRGPDMAGIDQRVGYAYHTLATSCSTG
jgi:hypothetical protein